MRLIPLLVVLALVATGCGTSNRDQTAAQQRVLPSPKPMSPQEQCVVDVMGLLQQSLQAMQDGYQNGIDPGPVMTQYGTQSAIYQVFVQAQGALAGDVISHGTDGALTRIQPQVRERCEVPR